MNRTRIVADSSCDLITLDEVSFVSVPLTIRTETQEFRDDASLDVETMVDTLRSTKGRSYSACPSVADWERAFGEDDDVLAFTITSGLSGSFRAACAAKLNCEENSPSRRICIIDSLSTGPEIVLLIEKAVSELSAGADFDAVCRSVQDYQRRTHLIFALESLHNLAQNGRVGKLAAAAAGMLGIRAVGTTSDEGTLDLLGKCRGRKRAVDFLQEEMERLGYTGGCVRIGHCRNTDSAGELRTAILHRFPGANIRIYPLRGLCSYYAECGGVLVGFEA